MTKPSAILADIIDICPETKEPQGIIEISGNVIITRGATTAWKHTITTEELNPDELPKPGSKPADERLASFLDLKRSKVHFFTIGKIDLAIGCRPVLNDNDINIWGDYSSLLLIHGRTVGENPAVGPARYFSTQYILVGDKGNGPFFMALTRAQAEKFASDQFHASIATAMLSPGEVVDKKQ